MSTSAKATQFAIVELDANNAIPATPAWDLMRLTADALQREEERTEVMEFGSGTRGIGGTSLDLASAAGTLGFTMHRADWVEKILPAVIGSDWAYDPLGLARPTVANECYSANQLRQFAIEKRFQVDDTPTYQYDRFMGSFITSVALTLEAEQPITGEISISCSTQELDSAIVTGATYTGAGENPYMTAPKVVSIELLDSGGTPLPWTANACITTASVTLDNEGTAYGCIGTEGRPQKQLNTQRGTVEFSVFYKGHELEKMVRAGTTFQTKITLGDGAGNEYEIWFPLCEVVEPTVVAGDSTTDEPLVEAATINALIASTPGQFVVMITRTHAP